MLASFGVGVQLARGLGVEGYGYYGLALSIVTIAGIPGELGLSKLVTREVAAADTRKDHATLFGVLRWADKTCWRISAVIAAGVIVAGLILLKERPSALGAAILLGAPMIPLLALSRIRGGALQGLRHIVLGQIPANLLRPLFLSVMLLLVHFAGIVMTPSWAMALNSVAAAIVFLIAHQWLRKRLPKAAPSSWIEQSGRRWLASSIPLALGEGISTLQSELTILLLGLLAAPADVGLFRVAVVTVVVARAPMIVLARVNMPMFARLHAANQRARLQKLVTYSAYAQTAGVLLLSLPLLVAPEVLLSTVFGPDFAPAANALRIIAVGQIVNAAFGPNVVLLNMTHQERRVTRAMSIGLALNVTTVLLFTSVLGIVGGAIGFVVSLLSWNVLTWLDGRRILAIDTSILAPRLATGL